MSTIKDFLCLLLVAVCHGIAGRMDHDDAPLLDKAQRDRGLTLDTGCTAAIPEIPESSRREFVDPGHTPTDADPCVVE